jgi:ABC-type nitrate/sulfonate/bicarbonate transport system permease component
VAFVVRPGRSRPAATDRLLVLGLGVALLAGWEMLARPGQATILFPPPSAIGRAFVHLGGDGTLGAHVGATLFRVGLGFLVGGTIGLATGLAMGWSRRARSILDPLVAAGHPVPKIALLPIVMILFGIGEASKVVIVAATAFFPMAISVMAGVQKIDPVRFDVAANYGARWSLVLRRVVIPGSLPLTLAGARLAFNAAFLVSIATETVAARWGIGAMIWFAWQTLRVEELYASVALTAALGVAANLLLQGVAARLTPWQTEEDG